MKLTPKEESRAKIMSRVLRSSNADAPITETGKTVLSSPHKALMLAKADAEAAKGRAEDARAQAEKAKMLRDGIESAAFNMFNEEEKDHV